MYTAGHCPMGLGNLIVTARLNVHCWLLSHGVRWPDCYSRVTCTLLAIVSWSQVTWLLQQGYMYTAYHCPMGSGDLIVTAWLQVHCWPLSNGVRWSDCYSMVTCILQAIASWGQVTWLLQHGYMYTTSHCLIGSGDLIVTAWLHAHCWALSHGIRRPDCYSMVTCTLRAIAPSGQVTWLLQHGYMYTAGHCPMGSDDMIF